MSQPKFEVADIGKRCYTINDHGRTVAIVTSQGYIDWLLKSPLQDGPLLTSIRKETHLSYTLGFKILLITPTPGTDLKQFSHRVEDGGKALVLTGHGETKDGHFASDTTATLRTDPRISRYEWDLDTTITCTAKEPQELSWIEYNNVYPSKAGLCMFYAPQKEYTCTLMTDRDGVVWKFPHQHLMHYGGKIPKLRFAKGTLGGFFGEDTGSPVVILRDSNQEPDWGICDMYYDLHCGARPKGKIQPGEKLTFRYMVKYLGQAESDKLMKAAKSAPVTKQDWDKHNYPRFELGMNRFTKNVQIDAFDDASGFRPRPPKKVWDREVGHKTKGSLRITNEVKEETSWVAEPPSNIPPQTTLKVSAMVKTQGVDGKGMFIRLKYHTFVWHPTPHVVWAKTIESKPVSGTSDGWVRVEAPELHVPEEHFDYLILAEVVLDGKGVGWLTEVDVDLQPAAQEQPVLEEGFSEKKSRGKQASKRKAAAAGATI